MIGFENVSEYVMKLCWLAIALRYRVCSFVPIFIVWVQNCWGGKTGTVPNRIHILLLVPICGLP